MIGFMLCPCGRMGEDQEEEVYEEELWKARRMMTMRSTWGSEAPGSDFLFNPELHRAIQDRGF